ncbi:DUF6232 family protein [Rhizobium giardinii]|uniref:DUF6232 family protein n=1 Tax=Rhizobium giardinii TaxID=56731 RepID=UPI003D6E8A6C
MSVQTFSNGLEISKGHVRLGEQTWAVGMIRSVGIGPAGTGLGIVFCGALALCFGFGTIHSLFSGGIGRVTTGLVLTSLCAYGAYASYKAATSSRVWIKTGLAADFVFKSRDKAEAEKVKAVLEEALAAHRPSLPTEG